MRDIIINEILIPSLFLLYEVDYDNIRLGVSERNICARLSLHMENLMRKYDDNHGETLFRGYFADVEYNRMGNGDLKHYENSNHRPVYMVSDLLIQSRGYPRNLLAVEMKRKGNNRSVHKDKERLKALVSSSHDGVMNDLCVHNTLVGAFIEYSPLGTRCELYENVRGLGIFTGEITLQYNTNGGSLQIW